MAGIKQSEPPIWSVIKLELGDGRSFKGLVLPRPNNKKDFLTLKLDSGYNIGIDIKNIKDYEIIEQPSQTIQQLTQSTQAKQSLSEKSSEKSFETQGTQGMISQQNQEVRKPPEPLSDKKTKKPKIAIIHTGGTIASRVDYNTGAVTADISPEYLLSMIPELDRIASIETFMLYNILSENLRFEHYNLLIKKLLELQQGFDGFIISHGTDTLHYTSAALSFALQGFEKPVVLVGSQRSSDRPSSDAWTNLLAAALFIVKALELNIQGVFASMHSSSNDDRITIFKGVNLRKMHTSSRNAFKQLNSKPIGFADLEKQEVVFEEEFLKGLNGDNQQIKELQNMVGDLNSKRFFNPKLRIGFLKIHPHMSVDEVLAFKGFNALIIEGSGLGHMPVLKVDELTSENMAILNALKDLSKETVLVMTSQCLEGRINLDVYSTARVLKPLVNGHLLDMTPETAFIKIAWLLSNYPKEKAIRLYSQNMVGEISSRSLKALN